MSQEFSISFALVFLSLSMIWVLSLAVLLGEIHDCFTGATTWKESFGLFDSNKKVGGIRFLKIGRLNISISLSKKGA